MPGASPPEPRSACSLSVACGWTGRASMKARARTSPSVSAARFITGSRPNTVGFAPRFIMNVNSSDNDDGDSANELDLAVRAQYNHQVNPQSRRSGSSRRATQSSCCPMRRGRCG